MGDMDQQALIIYLKDIGEHAVKIKLHRDVVATVKVKVSAEE